MAALLSWSPRKLKGCHLGTVDSSQLAHQQLQPGSSCPLVASLESSRPISTGSVCVFAFPRVSLRARRIFGHTCASLCTYPSVRLWYLRVPGCSHL